MKKIVVFMLIGTLCVPVFADEKEDRIAEIEAQIEELQAELRELKGDSPLSVTGDNFEFSIEEAFYPEVLHIAYSDTVIEADEGKRFMIVKVGIHNLTDETQYVDWLDFVAYLDKRSLELTDKCYSVETYDMISDEVMADRILDGYLIYEVPEAWTEIEIGYPDEYGEYLTITLSQDDLV